MLSLSNKSYTTKYGNNGFGKRKNTQDLDGYWFEFHRIDHFYFYINILESRQCLIVSQTSSLTHGLASRRIVLKALNNKNVC